MPLKNLEDLFVDELKDIYDAEKRITKALPKMAKKATHEELIAAFEDHLQQTEEQISRLDSIFENLDKAPGRKTCDAMVGLLEEGQKMMEEEAPESVMDAALIAAAQKVEHYEIATYGTLRDWANLLGNQTAARLLQQTLDEEGDTDKRLSQIALSLNLEAMEGEEGEEVSAGGGRRPQNRTANRPRHR